MVINNDDNDGDDDDNGVNGDDDDNYDANDDDDNADFSSIVTSRSQLQFQQSKKSHLIGIYHAVWFYAMQGIIRIYHALLFKHIYIYARLCISGKKVISQFHYIFSKSLHVSMYFLGANVSETHYNQE